MASNLRVPFALFMLAAAAPATAQTAAQDAQTGAPPQKQAELIVYGNDPCPPSTNGEIVVCSRRPENERYRVPKRFRGSSAIPAQESWTNTTASVEQAARVAGGLPDTCSAVGSGGQTGCQRAFLEQSRAERAQERQNAATIP